jgi:hypothetical protein
MGYEVIENFFLHFCIYFNNIFIMKKEKNQTYFPFYKMEAKQYNPPNHRIKLSAFYRQNPCQVPYGLR